MIAAFLLPAPVMAQDQQLVRELLSRVDVLERQIITLTGKIEELEFRLRNGKPSPQQDGGATSTAPISSPQDGRGPSSADGGIASILANDPDAIFRDALEAIRQGKHQAAAQALGELASRFPDAVIMPDVLYWQGQTARRLGDETLAASHFLEGMQRFSDSSRGADFLVETAASLMQLGETNDVCAILAQLSDNYPNARGLLVTRARQIGTNASCS
ncbi:MAG: hypothetical protein DBW67_03965 [SAR116 cluster bacterium]|nr:hypothetical protein [Paracoccaceae bacterium]RCL80304.1 MAG: hypothetical protein DBW67_03965 [SAR116 cluster bacterium]HCJ61259.1 hypothetical protein [Alphaproteobacteria bacterium]|tara:strand:+ start:433 stop:1080 length:648 start_codon:yes stop_codon:yes gene_type:complete